MLTKKLQILDSLVKQAENADTLDGKHAAEFANADDMDTAQSNISDLRTLVGDTAVSEQISTAMADTLTIDTTDAEAGIANLINADTLGGVLSSDFVLDSELNTYKNEVATNYLLKTGTAANSSKAYGYNLSELLAYIYPVGATYTTSTNSDPSSYLSGTWELIDKRLASHVYTSTTVFTVNSDNATLSNARAIANDHEIRISLQVKNVDAWSDTSVEIGTLNFSNFGISGTYYTLYILGQGDGANGISFASLNYSTGLLSHIDCVTKTSGGTLTASNTIYYDFNIKVPYGSLLDDFCDQFIWKRTA